MPIGLVPVDKWAALAESVPQGCTGDGYSLWTRSWQEGGPKCQEPVEALRAG